MIPIKCVWFFISLGAVMGQIPNLGFCPDYLPMSEFDMSRFLGKWYEAERYFTFSEVASRCVVTDYAKANSGRIYVSNEVTNRLTGVKRIINGNLQLVGKGDEGKLHVRYATTPIPSETTFMVLETDYDNFAVVWSCSGFGPVHAHACTLPNNAQGKCTNIKNCSVALTQLKKRIKPQTCSFEGAELIVCCPNNNPTNKGINFEAIAKEKCEEIKSHHPDKYTGYVIGGINAESKKYVHMAALGYGDYDKVQWNCGGTLISNKFVLTAAHCISSRDIGLVNWVRLGDLDLVATNDTADPRDFGIRNRIRHPDYKPPIKYNDIALLELDKTVEYTEYMLPACIQIGSDFPTNVGFYATGWGLIDFLGERSSHLQEVQLRIRDNSECAESYPAQRRYLSTGIVETQLCASGNSGELKDTCSGDSGGPLQYINLASQYYSYNGFTVFGVTSFGKSCGASQHPGVYTRVSSYVPWIVQNVWLN